MKGYAGKARAKVKSLFPNTGNTVTYGYTGKAGAIPKSPIPNAGNAVPHGYAGKAGTTVKSPSPNTGNAVWYGKCSACFSFRILNQYSFINIIQYAVF